MVSCPLAPAVRGVRRSVGNLCGGVWERGWGYVGDCMCIVYVCCVCVLCICIVRAICLEMYGTLAPCNDTCMQTSPHHTHTLHTRKTLPCTRMILPQQRPRRGPPRPLSQLVLHIHPLSCTSYGRQLSLGDLRGWQHHLAPLACVGGVCGCLYASKHGGLVLAGDEFVSGYILFSFFCFDILG